MAKGLAKICRGPPKDNSIFMKCYVQLELSVNVDVPEMREQSGRSYRRMRAREVLQSAKHAEFKYRQWSYDQRKTGFLSTHEVCIRPRTRY